MSLTRVLARGLHSSTRRHALSKFSMPAMSPTMTEGGIASWKKKEGEPFSAGDVLLEIETDKATMDVEAQDDGILAKIIRGDNSKNVPVGIPIAIIAEEGDDLAGAADLAKEAESEKPPAKSESESESKPEPKKEEPKKEESKPKESSKPKETSSKPELQAGAPIFATPIAKKIALERGIPLAKVKGSGPDGRILREDVEKFQGSAGAAASTTAAAAPAESYTEIPVSNMRRTIGQRLTQSKQEVPHYYVTSDIDMGKVLKIREVFNASLAGKEGAPKLSVNDFIVKAVALAMQDVPEVNSSWLGDKIRQNNVVDVSVAVATPTGLITPIVKNVATKGLTAISTESKSLASKARAGKLQPQEYQGGTFTVSNLGMFGVSHFTAIINSPQSCILAVGSTQPVIVPAPEEEKGWRTAQIMKVTLSSDHRTVDGAVAARWLQAFKGYLENPLTFML
ncbi:pyruvate dehydrogenase E2 component (dihydrolipoamide acetyltransferase) [Rhizoctonia solani AG-1 IB]|uniref:Acetyltransferase component of pyruvate dehydrogenase complex n=1 Tax=Thanatephorus cucumeris (strain AG1-IB / isolate 7/3/14) TaxID=1108050 RepID=A0A0B7FGN4_THACB|nr:pyruvate dehydrogenase E2 component (dihydrolipoamide acetyltransferase) [Rhizoctonia solani AG-1 IB]